MSVYSRCVDARGTTTMLSTPALRQASYPVARSRLGSGPFGDGWGVSDEPPLVRYGEEVKNERASSVPTTKLDSCWAGTPGQPNCSPSCGVAKGLQKGRALLVVPGTGSCGNVSVPPCPWTS